MSNRRKIRELALQILFTWDAHGQNDREMAEQVTQDATDDPAIRAAATESASKAWDQRQTIDAWLERLAPQWPPRRQPGVDRNLIRLGVWELTNSDTPPRSSSTKPSNPPSSSAPSRAPPSSTACWTRC